MADEHDTKRCGRCNEEKPVDEFPGDKRRIDGRYPWCKPCCCDYQRVLRIARNAKRSNLQVTCVSCNRKKQAQDPIVFANSIGLLI
jgi:hypothetical protein